MLAVGTLMIFTSWWAGWQLFLRKKNLTPMLLQVISAMTFSGWVGVLAGWYVTEIGRQPWIVSGVLKVSDVVADHSSGMVLSTLIGYLALYAFILVSYIATLRYLSTKPAASLIASGHYTPRSTNEEHH